MKDDAGRLFERPKGECVAELVDEHRDEHADDPPEQQNALATGQADQNGDEKERGFNPYRDTRQPKSKGRHGYRVGRHDITDKNEVA